MCGVQWENGYGGWAQRFFCFPFFEYQSFGEIWPKNSKIYSNLHFKNSKNSQKNKFSLSKNAEFSPQTRTNGYPPPEKKNPPPM